MQSMISRFSSKCHGCGQPILKGAAIQYDRIVKRAYHDRPECLESAPKQYEPDWFDMDYEDQCAAICGL